jgi:hypothetical protein
LAVDRHLVRLTTSRTPQSRTLHQKQQNTRLTAGTLSPIKVSDFVRPTGLSQSFPPPTPDCRIFLGQKSTPRSKRCGSGMRGARRYAYRERFAGRGRGWGWGGAVLEAAASGRAGRGWGESPRIRLCVGQSVGGQLGSRRAGSASKLSRAQVRWRGLAGAGVWAALAGAGIVRPGLRVSGRAADIGVVQPTRPPVERTRWDWSPQDRDIWLTNAYNR